MKFNSRITRIYLPIIIGVNSTFTLLNSSSVNNPKSNNLEHIAFDCYAGIEEGIEDIIYGYSDKISFDFKMNYLSKQFFNNELFVSNYKKFLNKFSEPEYLASILNKYKHSSDSLNTILKYELREF